MNPEARTEWTKALRSGEYEQGKGQLRATDKDGVDRFCCLGVLCDLAVKAGLGEWVDPDPDYDETEYGYRHFRTGRVSTALPPEGLLIDLGLTDVGGYGEHANYAGHYGETPDTVGGRQRALADDNDAEGHTFAQIADTIEREF